MTETTVDTKAQEMFKKQVDTVRVDIWLEELRQLGKKDFWRGADCDFKYRKTLNPLLNVRFLCPNKNGIDKFFSQLFHDDENKILITIKRFNEIDYDIHLIREDFGICLECTKQGNAFDSVGPLAALFAFAKNHNMPIDIKSLVSMND